MRGISAVYKISSFLSLPEGAKHLGQRTAIHVGITEVLPPAEPDVTYIAQRCANHRMQHILQ
jgi:hypothetical protein